MLNIFRFTSMLSAFTLFPITSLYSQNPPKKHHPLLRRDHLNNALLNIHNIDQALSLFHHMLLLKPRPYNWHFHKLLTIVFKLEHYALVVVLFKKMVFYRCPLNQYFMSTLINCYCKVEEVGLCFPVIGYFLKRGLPPDVVCFNGLIKGLFLGECGEEGRRMFRMLVGSGVEMDRFSVPIVVDGMCKGGDVVGAWGVLKVAEKRGWKVDVVAYNSMMDGFCKKGMLEDGRALLGRMIDRNAIPNIVTYNTFIHGLCNHNNLGFACRLFSDLPSKGVLPNLVTYTVIIQGLCKRGQFQIAKDILENMERDGVVANSITCNIIVDQCLRHCDNFHSVNLLKLIVRRDFQLYASTFFVLMRQIPRIRKMNDSYDDDVMNSLILKLTSNNCVHESYNQALIDSLVQKLY